MEETWKGEMEALEMERGEGSHQRPGRFICETNQVPLRMANLAFREKKILRVMWDHGPYK